MNTADFFYDLPEQAIAQTPVEPRHAARMLDTRDMSDRVFADFPSMLKPGDLVVVNRTKVRAARLGGAKVESGGAVEVLLLAPLAEYRWEVLVRPARRIRAGLQLKLPGRLEAVVIDSPVEGRCTIEFVGDNRGDVESLVEEHGEVPLPPYIRSTLTEPDRYQTVFAGPVGSAAAPTAGLHFSEGVLDELERLEIGLASVDLRVGLDTFRPISTPQIEDHRMHSERVTVPRETCEAIRDTHGRGGRVVAIGTTVVRSLESAVDEDGQIQPFDGSTRLFINPGYEFRAIDGVVTNFHVPGSTLVVLIAAILGERWRNVYQVGIERGYRFLSFGDAMFAEVERR